MEIMMKIATLILSLSFALSAIASDTGSDLAPTTSVRPMPRPDRTAAPLRSIRPMPRPAIITSRMQTTVNLDGSRTLLNPQLAHQGKTYLIDSGSKPNDICRAMGFEKQLEFTSLKEGSDLTEVLLLDGQRAVYRSRPVREITCLIESQRERFLDVQALRHQRDGSIRIEEPSLIHGGQKFTFSAQSYPSDICRLFGLFDLEVSTIFSNGFPGSESMLIGLDGVEDLFYDDEIGAVVCRERPNSVAPSNLRPQTTIRYGVGDFRPSFFLSRGIKLIEN
jgi:hypothetical protein